MFSYLLKSGVSYTILSFLQPALAFLLLPLITQYYSKESYGIYVLLLVFSAFFTLISGLSISHAMNNFHFNYISDLKTSKDFLKSIFQYATLFNIGIFLVGGVLIVTFYSNPLLTNTTIFLAILCGLSEVYSNSSLVYYKNLKKIRIASICSLISILTNLVFSLLVILNKFNLSFLFLAKFATNVLILILVYFIEKLWQANTQFKLIKTGLAYSIKLIPWLVFAWFLYYIDRFIIEDKIDIETLGTFGIVITISGAIQIFYTGATGAIQPLFMDAFLKKEKKKEIEFLSWFVHLAGVGFLGLISLIGLIEVVLGEQYLDIGKNIFLASFAFFFTIPHYVVTVELIAQKRPQLVGFFNSFSGIAYLVIIFFDKSLTLSDVIFYFLFSKIIGSILILTIFGIIRKESSLVFMILQNLILYVVLFVAALMLSEYLQYQWAYSIVGITGIVLIMLIKVKHVWRFINAN
ncbi:MAG: oligosaccharide flippase family protein [Flavobacteriales bacterium]|nr:oligosaccharide flippase family protein [Flavobacteriales bacterium]